MNCTCLLPALVNEKIDINNDISGKQNFNLKTMNENMSYSWNKQKC